MGFETQKSSQIARIIDAPPGRGIGITKPFKSESGVLDEVDITGIGERLLIPRIHIWGSQVKEEYNKETMTYVHSLLKEDPMDFLLRNPVVVCALPEGSLVDFVLLNGHNRFRESGKFRSLYGGRTCNYIPSQILTIEQYVEIWNNHPETPLTTTAEFRNRIRNAQYDAFDSFKNSLPWDKYPKSATVEDLKKFQTF